MSLTRSQLRVLMAMYLRVDSTLIDAESQQVYPTPELPSERGQRLDIALEAEAGGTRLLSVADGFQSLLRGDGYDSLVSMRMRAPETHDAQVRYGEIYVLDSDPRRAPLPSPYRRGMGKLVPADDLAGVTDSFEVSVAWKNQIVAGGTIQRFGETPFATGMVHVSRDHRGRGLGAYIAVVTAQRIQGLGMLPVTMVSDGESESRWTLRWIGYRRAVAVGALSVRKDAVRTSG